MSAIADEMKNAVSFLGGNRSWNDNRKTWLARAADSAGISYRATYSLFYQQDGEPSRSTVEKVRAAVAKRKLDEAHAVAELEESYVLLLREIVEQQYALFNARLAVVESHLRGETAEGFRASTHSQKQPTNGAGETVVAAYSQGGGV